VSEARPSSEDALVLFGGYATGDTLGFVRLNLRSGAIVARGEDLSAAPPAATPKRIVLVLAGVEAQVRRVALPARSEAQARGAAALMLKGAIAAAPETMHYAIGDPVDTEGGRLVAVVAKARMQQWLDVCAKHGIEPHSALVDFTIWPSAPDAVEIVETPPLTLVTAGARGGYAIESGLAPALFPRWFDGVRADAHTVRLAADRRAWSNALVGASVEDIEGEDAFAVLAEAAAAPPAHAPELLQGAYAPQAERRGTARSAAIWRTAAALALIAVMLQIGSLIFSGLRDARAARETMAQAEQDFREARPDVRRIVNLRAQVRALLNSAEQSTRHPVLAVSEPLINAVQANPLVRIDAVRHAAPGRRVSVQVSARDLQALNAAAQTLREGGAALTSRDLQPIDGRHASEWEVEVP
jgi:general secretion pathway protein L